MTPGANSTSGCTDGATAPTPDSITINYTGASTAITIPVYVLGYNCTYQGGSVFAIDDSTPAASSIAGKVFATADQTSSAVWASEYDPIWGIDDSSTTSTPSPDSSSLTPATYTNGQLKCEGMSDGLCNSNNIFAFASMHSSNYPTSTASTMCSQALTGANSSTCTAGTADCYNDWYLPAICELDSVSNGVDSCPCPLRMQSVRGSIPSFSNLSFVYWSSTEYSLFPMYLAWQELFDSNGVGYQDNSGDKKVPHRPSGGRCVRGLIN